MPNSSLLRKSRKNEKSAIILCSGGLDSVTTANYAKKYLKYSNIIILFFNYGQKSLIQERKCAKICSQHIMAKFMEIKLPELKALSTSLINIKGRIKKLEKKDLKDTRKESEKWYVPARNLVFLSYALSLSDSLFKKEKKKYNIFLGFKCEGQDSYPDSTQEFIKEMNKINKIASESKPKIKAPLTKKDKEDIILLASGLGVDLRNTFSCYVSGFKHCGSCLSCMLRKQGFYWSGIKDPTSYLK